MKKIVIFSILALCLGVVSCDNVDLPNPPAQSNPQEVIFDKKDLAVEADPAAQTVANLTELNQISAPVPVAQVSKCDNLPAGYTLKFIARVSKNDDFNGAPEVACVYNGTSIGIMPDVLNGVLRSFSKDVVDQTVNVMLLPYIVSETNESTQVKVETSFGSFQVKATPFEPTTVIEQSYYLLLSTDGETWDKSGAIVSDHSSTNVYDDPVFKFIYTVTQDQIDNGGMFWKVIPASVYNMTDWQTGAWYGTTEDEQPATEGTLVTSLDESTVPGLNMMVAGPQLMTVNMENLSFSYIKAIPFFYTPGGGNGWDAGASQLMQTTDYVNYFGYIHGKDGFKFNPDNGWKGNDFGVPGDLEYTPVDKEGTVAMTAKGTANGGSNINVPEDGLYFVKLNYNTRALTVDQIVTYGVIGDATPLGWGGQTNLTPSADFLTWTGTIHFNGTGEFKFRANNNWDISLGGDLSNLNPNNGPNIATPGEGDYIVTLNLGVYPYSATLVKK